MCAVLGFRVWEERQIQMCVCSCVVVDVFHSECILTHTAWKFRANT